ncbi:hemolysin activation protein [Xenophilus sp. AP218F]|nr:hemolysin activation protein [Xenophilus sp. AP218F]
MPPLVTGFRLGGLAALLAAATAAAAEMPLAELPHPMRRGDEARRLMQDNSRRFDDIIQQQRVRQLQQGGMQAQRDEAGPPAQSGCLPVAAVRLSGVTLLAREEVMKQGLPAGDCLDLVELNRFVRQLTALYLQKGYIAARVTVEGPDAAGVLTVAAQEGRVARIEPGESGLDPATLFPGVPGRPLNIHDIDQGLDQANRLQSNRAKVDIAPGERAGDSILQLSNPPAKPWAGSLSLDNAGRDSTGRVNLGGSASLDNPFGLNDFISLSAQRTADDNAERHSRSESLFYSLPYGYWTFSAFASRADYLNPQRLLYSTVALSGNTAQTGARVDRVLYRDQSQVTTADLQLTQKRVRNYFQDVELGISSPTLTVLEAGLSRMQLFDGGMLLLDGSAQRGVRWLGADVLDQRFPNLPNPQFFKLKLTASWYQTLALPGGPWQWQSQLAGQASRDRLPGVEQLDVADSSAVRGFRNNGLPGETAWYWRNTLSRRVGLGDWALTPRLGLDAGRVLLRESSTPWQGIAGASVGLNLAWRRASLDLEYSQPLGKPGDWPGQGHLLFARLAWGW